MVSCALIEPARLIALPTRREIFIARLIALLSLLVAGNACRSEGPLGPTPSPSPGPSGTPGAPYATALTNLPAIMALEEATGRQTILVAVAGGSDLDGRQTADGVWQYVFFDSARRQFFEWWAHGSGVLEDKGLHPDPRVGLGDISSFLATDSDAVVRAARQHGGDRYIERYPEQVRVGMIAYTISRSVAWEVRFYASPRVNPSCQVTIFIDAQSAALRSAETLCLDW